MAPAHCSAAKHKHSTSKILSAATTEIWENMPDDMRPQQPPSTPTPSEIVSHIIRCEESNAVALFEERLFRTRSALSLLSTECVEDLEPTIQVLEPPRHSSQQLSFIDHPKPCLPLTPKRVRAAIKLWAILAQHTDAVKGTFPLTPLIERWIVKPTPIKANRTQGIIPVSMMPHQPAYFPVVQQNEPPTYAGVTEMPDNFLNLPLILNEDQTDQWRYLSPILLAEANAAGLRRGSGARLDKRLLMLSIFSMPASERKPGGRFEVRKTLRSIFSRWLWPPTKNRPYTTWKKSRHGVPFLNALNAMKTIGIPDGTGLHHPVYVRRTPYLDSLDNELILEIVLPPRSGHGPMIDTQLLAAQGRISDPAFDLQIALAYLWDEAKRRNQGQRVYDTRPEVQRNNSGLIIDQTGTPILDANGEPTTDWSHPDAIRTGRLEPNPAVKHVPALDKNHRRELAYSPYLRADNGIEKKTPKRIRVERASTKKLLLALEAQGLIVIKRDGDDWRIVQPNPYNTIP